MPQPRFFKARFYETYHYASIVRNVLNDQFSYIRILNDFYGDTKYLQYIKPFQKYSAFHSFLYFVVSNVVIDEINEIGLDALQDQFDRDLRYAGSSRGVARELLPVERAMVFYEIEHTDFVTWLSGASKTFLDAGDDDVADYYNDLYIEGPLDDLTEQIVSEVFFLLFQNRDLLLRFNDMMSRQLSDTDIDEVDNEHRHYFTSRGTLRRMSIPSWVKRAVHYRDRGFCTACHKDLSGTLNISNMAQFDHIVPLAQGGLNDVSNMQLLCQPCNLKKHAKDASTSSLYESWYPAAE